MLKWGKFKFLKIVNLVNLFLSTFLLRKKLWGGGWGQNFKFWPKFTKIVGGRGSKAKKNVISMWSL